jgi:sensor histidine kinase regulating citrate/malate metabolism
MNALEATAPGGEVRVAASGSRGDVHFHVHNAGEIRRTCRRGSSSARSAPRRRAGAPRHHGMKLLGERYLGGVVSFTSDAAGGTIFTIQLPVRKA